MSLTDDLAFFTEPGQCANRRTSGTEVDLWQLVRKNITDAHLTRIENVVGQGMSDVHCCRQGMSCWIELKVFKGNKISFRKSQPPWISKQVQHGGRVWILARRLDAMLLFKGADIPELLSAGVAAIDDLPSGKADTSVLERLTTFKTSKPFDWPRLRDIIFSPAKRPTEWL